MPWHNKHHPQLNISLPSWFSKLRKAFSKAKVPPESSITNFLQIIPVKIRFLLTSLGRAWILSKKIPKIRKAITTQRYHKLKNSKINSEISSALPKEMMISSWEFKLAHHLILILSVLENMSPVPRTIEFSPSRTPVQNVRSKSFNAMNAESNSKSGTISLITCAFTQTRDPTCVLRRAVISASLRKPISTNILKCIPA